MESTATCGRARARRRPPSGGSARREQPGPVAAGGQAPGGCGPYWDAWRGEEEVMGATADRMIYVGTMDGVFLAERENGGYKTRPIGLQGKGAVRSPVVIDREDPRRLYAATSKGGVFRSEDGGET